MCDSGMGESPLPFQNFFYAENDKIDEKCWMIGLNKNKFRITHTKDEPEGMDGYGHHSIFWLDVIFICLTVT